MAPIASDLLADIIDAAQNLNPGDCMSPQALRAIARHAGARDIRRSVETGAGGSTLLLSNLSAGHTAFAIEGEHKAISRVKSSLLFRAETANFVEGPTQRTLAAHAFGQPLDAVLIDGPHAFPFPQLEYFHLYRHIAAGGLLVLDDIHIRSIHDLYRFLCVDEMFELLEVVERTAFFQRTNAPVFDPGGDGWWLQQYNRKTLARYKWRDIPRRIARKLTERRVVLNEAIYIDAPGEVGETALIRGRCDIPNGIALWVFVHRSDVAGWWPQGGAPAVVANGRWEQTCRFGSASDIGQTFEVAAVALDSEQSRRILRWFEESALSGRGDPLNLPAPSAGIRVAIRRVLRALEGSV